MVCDMSPHLAENVAASRALCIFLLPQFEFLIPPQCTRRYVMAIMLVPPFPDEIKHEKQHLLSTSGDCRW